MIPKIDWREIVHLYGLTLLTVTGFFLLGLYVGRWLPSETGSARLADPVAVGSSGSEAKPRLEFYGRLNDPTSRGAGGAGSNTSPVPKPGTEGAGAVRVSEDQSSGSAQFTVQIAALEQEEEARRMLMRARARDYPAAIHRVGPNHRYYGVWVGEFATKAEAHRWAQRLYDDGFNTYVRSMSDSP